MFVTTAALWMALVTPGFETCRRHFGQDFLAFYTAGSLAAEGRWADLYDLDVVRDRERAIAQRSGLALGNAVGPWWNPPVYAWLFAPLSRLPFGAALLVWSGINLAATGTALWLLCRLIPTHQGLTVVLVMASAPFVQSLTHAQNTPISLLLVAATAHAWRGGRSVAAGALTGLLLYKPQLAAAIAVVLVLHRGWRAAGGLCAVAGFILAATVLTMPGALSGYFHRMPVNLHFMQAENTYLWERHVTLKAFWRLLLQGRGAGETTPLVYALTAASTLPLAGALARLTWRARRGDIDVDALVAATVLTAPLLMPFYFDYDLLLLAVPAILAANHVRAENRPALLIGWSTLYLWLFVNPFVGSAFRLNLAVPLVACVAAIALRRAIRIQNERTRDETVFTGSQPPLASSRKAA